MDDAISEEETAALLNTNTRTLQRWRANQSHPELTWLRLPSCQVVYSRWTVEAYSFGHIQKGDAAERQCSPTAIKQFLSHLIPHLPLKPVPPAKPIAPSRK